MSSYTRRMWIEIYEVIQRTDVIESSYTRRMWIEIVVECSASKSDEVILHT